MSPALKSFHNIDQGINVMKVLYSTTAKFVDEKNVEKVFIPSKEAAEELLLCLRIGNALYPPADRKANFDGDNYDVGVLPL